LLHPNLTPFQRHDKKCFKIADQTFPEDPDQPAEGDEPYADPTVQGREDLFDPAARERTPLTPDPIPLADDVERDVQDADINLSLYRRNLEPHSLNTYPGVNLQASGIICNKKYRVFICLTCGSEIGSRALSTHLLPHPSHAQLPKEIVAQISQEFNLSRDFSDVAVPSNRHSLG
jgi:hypothetical protein